MLKKILILYIVVQSASFANTDEAQHAAESTVGLLSESEKEQVLITYLKKNLELSEESNLGESVANGRGLEAIVHSLKEGRLSPYFEFSSGLSLVEFSVLMNNIELSSYLLTTYKYSERALQNLLDSACANKYLDIVGLLVDRGADINKKEIESGRLCIFLALDNLDLKMVSYLVKNGVDLSVVDKSGLTPKEKIERIKNKVNKLEESLLEKSN